MSHFIETYKQKYVFVDKPEKFDIEIGTNYLILPIKLDEEESAQLTKELLELDKKKTSTFSNSWGRYHRYYSVEIFQNKITVKEKNNHNNTIRYQLSIENVKEGIKLKIGIGGTEREELNDILKDSVLGKKLKEHWVQKENTSQKEAEKMMEYITNGKTMEKLKEETSFEAALQTEMETNSTPKMRTKRETRYAFKKMDQELPLRIQQLKPKDQLKTKKQLEYLMWQELSYCKTLDEEKIQELKEKLAYWDSLGLDTKEPREKIASALSGLERKIRQTKEEVRK